MFFTLLVIVFSWKSNEIFQETFPYQIRELPLYPLQGVPSSLFKYVDLKPCDRWSEELHTVRRSKTVKMFEVLLI